MRNRIEDIPLLVEHFMNLFRRQGKRVIHVSSSALPVLESYTWPGNVRQLRNVLESAIFWAELRHHKQIEVEDLPPEVRQGHGRTEMGFSEIIKLLGSKLHSGPVDIHEELARLELAYLEEALRLTRCRKTDAWKLLGYHDRFTLYRRVRRIFSRYPHLSKEFSLVTSSFRASVHGSSQNS